MAQKTIIDCPHNDKKGKKGPQVIIGGTDCPHWIPKEEKRKKKTIKDKKKI